MKTFQATLNAIRKSSLSEREKGEKFERIIQGYLLSSPIYTPLLKKVWMWNDFPYKNQFGGKDLGIDLIAQSHEGGYWAIQCKCYQETTEIDKAEVDSFISTSGKTFMTDSGEEHFIHRLWISTTNRWGANAEETIQHQNPPISRLSLHDLEDDSVDWEKLENHIFGREARGMRFEPKPHQKEALEKAKEYFKTHDRGKMIMACGTGKTFTSLRLAEQETGGKGLVLFLVPSIALLGQILREWMAQCNSAIYPICICSDSGVSKKVRQDSDDISTADLALPASTDISTIIRRLRYASETNRDGLTVVFSTYQSINVISEAQQKILKGENNSILGQEPSGFGVFDLVICDESHRTTGVTLKGEEDKNFVKVHYDHYIRARKRVYMTATPRLYTDSAKTKADNADAILCSMDDINLYGEEFYKIGFGEAVEKHLLADYKVLILTIKSDNIPPVMRKYITNENGEVNADDAGKMIGCINALSKKIIGDARDIIATDPEPMHRAVAFCSNIKTSKDTTTLFNDCKTQYMSELTDGDRKGMVNVICQHIDGSMSAPVRDEKLAWLKSASESDNECRILTNVRCLSEGVDVPSLDAILFLSPRNSQVDVVQSVGRVMRISPRTGKKYGYIIIPVVAPSDTDADEMMEKSDRFKVVWSVLNALRAHDDRFSAMVNKMELNKSKPRKVLIGGISGATGDDGEWKHSNEDNKNEHQLEIPFEELSATFYAKMVQKVGDRRYWEQWAKDVADIAKKHIDRIRTLIAEDGKPKREFERFVKGLRKNINPSVTEEDAIEMLSQHIITKPVFEALFDSYSFVMNNPISQSMQKVLDAIEEHVPDEENKKLEKFYESVKKRAEGIDCAEGKQRVIIELYDKFFKAAFPKIVEKLGIVYTPVEVVDYIIKSVSMALKQDFGKELSDRDIHILDPFTGTGTFITRLLQSGLISRDALERKYKDEIHANEIVLLAYYIASINIENAYHDIAGEQDGYKAFEGICLTDTFQTGEYGDMGSDVFPYNSKRVTRQKGKKITVCLGNPPYSVGQKSANDNAQNMHYPMLDEAIAKTYVQTSNANLNKSAYDSYIRAFRWATDRIGEDGGIIGYVSNGSWLDSNGLDGFRKSLETEFSKIYVFNLRGNQRTSGELSRREGGKIFGSGSRTPITITILVKKPKKSKEKAEIFYHDIGDYLSREDKLKTIRELGHIGNPAMNWKRLEPNEHGDWINRRNETFISFIRLEPEKKYNSGEECFFTTYSLGIATNKDAFIYNSSRNSVKQNVDNMVAFYEQERQLCRQDSAHKPCVEPSRIVWTDMFLKALENNYSFHVKDTDFRIGMYRPFFKQNMCYQKDLLQRTYQQTKIYPPCCSESNLCICVSGIGVTKPFSCLVTDHIPDLEFIGKSQCFPLYWYEIDNSDMDDIFNQNSDNTVKYIRRNGVTDWILRQCRNRYGNKVTREDIFFYIYGILHSPDYRTAFDADLKKMLPRIPFVDTADEQQAIKASGWTMKRIAESLGIAPETLTYYWNTDDCPISVFYRVGEIIGYTVYYSIKEKENEK